MKSTANARDNDGGAAAEWVAVDELRPWPENPRLNDGEPVKRVMASIERFGFAAPIVARRSDRTIIAGHTRWKAAQALGLARVPVRFVDLSANEARLLALADNRYTELTEWDEVALQSILSDIGLTDAAFVGWSSADMDAMADDLLGADDESDKIRTDFSVIIECASEAEQLDVIAQCEERGWRCRP